MVLFNKNLSNKNLLFPYLPATLLIIYHYQTTGVISKQRQRKKYPGTPTQHKKVVSGNHIRSKNYYYQGP